MVDLADDALGGNAAAPNARGLYEFTEHAQFWKAGNGKNQPELMDWAPTRRKIDDLLDALGAIVGLSDDFRQPCWLDGRETGPIVAVSNGLLDVASRILHAHSPAYFGPVSVASAYDPNAKTPETWLNFLNELWPNSQAAKDVLGEWFGYILSGRTDLHKIFLMVGPPRGGRGVIARILTTLIGTRNVCGPKASSLEEKLEPLIGKALAIIGDMRAALKNQGAVETMLSISGEDTLTIDRKYKGAWTGKLSIRIHIISNELPRLADASTAIVSRLVILLTSESWLGREDHELENKIRPEMTGILNWALDGLYRLTVTNKNRLTYFAAADEAIRTMQDLASPVHAFVRERCKIGAHKEGVDKLQIKVDELYSTYQLWCEDNEQRKSSKVHFGRDLQAAFPSVIKRRLGKRNARYFIHEGIRLRKDEDEDEDDDDV